MSMDGRRFGIGLAVGVLLGIGVVAASGVLGASQVPFLPSSASYTTKIDTVTTTSATASATSAQTGAGDSGTPGTTNGSSTAAETTTSGTSSLSFPSANPPSSRFASVASQPLAIDGLLLVPILVAFLLGAAAFKASARGRTVSEKEEGRASQE